MPPHLVATEVQPHTHHPCVLLCARQSKVIVCVPLASACCLCAYCTSAVDDLNGKHRARARLYVFINNCSAVSSRQYPQGSALGTKFGTRWLGGRGRGRGAKVRSRGGSFGRGPPEAMVERKTCLRWAESQVSAGTPHAFARGGHGWGAGVDVVCRRPQHAHNGLARPLSARGVLHEGPGHGRAGPD